tara:strand:+ start:926 stop:1366 length:441 start_codon:yes stop_codon:yes gene_type:complete
VLDRLRRPAPLAGRLREAEHIFGPGILRQCTGDAGERDHASELLVLLIGARAQHLVEILLVDARATGSIKTFDHERRQSVELLDPGIESRESEATCEARAVLLIEDDSWSCGQLRLQDVRRREAAECLVPPGSGSRQDDLRLDAAQ